MVYFSDAANLLLLSMLFTRNHPVNRRRSYTNQMDEVFVFFSFLQIQEPSQAD